MNWEIEIDEADAMCAATVASMQMLNKIREQRLRDHGSRSTRGQVTRWANTIQGLMGEIACARLLRLNWKAGAKQIVRGDLPYGLEVRATEWPDGHLTVYRDDTDDHVVVLVTGVYPHFTARGFLSAARDGKQARWWREGGNLPCFWVPQGALNPMDLIELHVVRHPLLGMNTPSGMNERGAA